MKLLKQVGLVLLAALSLVGLTLAAGHAGFLAQPDYYARIGSNKTEPINVIISERLRFEGTYIHLEDALRWVGGWYENNCYNPLVTYQGAGIKMTWSTDNGTNYDPGFPFVGCGNGERNHFRAFLFQDQSAGVYFRETLYVAASLETIKGGKRFDGANNYQGICGQIPGSEGAVHCLTRDAFDWGRDGYEPPTSEDPTDRGLWPDLQTGWAWARGWAMYGYMITLSPAPTDWISQAGAAFRGDGRAGLLEDADSIALGRPATASTYAPDFPPSGAVDAPGNGSEFNNAISKWASGNPLIWKPPHWLKVDLGSPAPRYDTVQITSGWWNSSGYYTLMLRDYDVQVSDNGSTWTTVASVRGTTAAVVTKSIGSRTNRWIRLFVISANGTPEALVFSFKVMRRP